MEFSADQWLRFSRQIQQQAVGIEGQKRLCNAHVVIVGMGGLGCPAAHYLSAAGIGKLTLIDKDIICQHNLHRQLLYTKDQVGQRKVEAAQKRLQQHNPDCHINIEPCWLGTEHQALIATADVVLDCTDQYQSRYLLNYLCKISATPWCFASVQDFSAQTAFFTPSSACYQCVYPQPPTNTSASCSNLGILGAVPGFIGVQQALSALKYLLHLPCGENTLSQWNLLDYSVQHFSLQGDSHCPTCQGNWQPSSKPDTAPEDSSDQGSSDQDSSDKNSSDMLCFSTINDWPDLVIDVRSNDEHKAFNLGGSNIPLPQLAVEAKRLPRDKNILLYCQSGIRSRYAAELLRPTHARVAVLEGGILQALEHETRLR